MALAAQRSELIAHRVDDRAVDDPHAIGERGGADLRHDPHAQGSSWYSKLKLAIHTTSPSCAPARDSMRGTPSRFSW